MCPRRFPLFALSLFLALLLVPSRALALDFIPKGLAYSADLEGSRYGAVAIAANQFDAACYALGKEPASISTSIRSKLSDPNYGGRFYDFSQAFYTQGWPLEEVPDWLPIYVWGSLEWSDLLLSDYQSVWYVTCTQSLRSGALVDFLAVLNGEDLGGGSGGEVVEESGYYYFGGPTHYFTGTYTSGDYYLSSNGVRYTYDKNRFNSSGYAPLPSTLLFRLRTNICAKINTAYPFDSNKWFAVIGLYEGYPSSLAVYAGPTADVSFSSQEVAGIGTVSYISSVSFPSGGAYYSWNGSGDSYRPAYSFDGTLLTNSYTGYPFGNYKSNMSAGYTIYAGTQSTILTSDYSSFVEPTPPAGTWPEPSTPAAPVEPTFPDPATPTVQPDPVVTEPTVTWPSPTITIDPDPVPGTTPTGLDYTELLTRINDNLISIDSFVRAINSNLNSLRSDLVNEFNGVVQGLRNVYTYLQHMDDVLERHCVHLQNKLEDVSVDIQNKIREMVRWLADELDFESEESGSSDLFGMLSTISDKLGGGTYEPNPLKDESAYYLWLDDLWDRFLLGDNWQASASSMSQSFGQLTSRFPFSVPWDIVALFRLFVHDPVTPVFDLPLYYSADDYATVHVDLSGWDGVAAVVRPLVFVIFALNLALLSRHLLAGFGADKGGL